MRRTYRSLVVAGATVTALAVASAAVAYYSLSSTSANASPVARTLAAAGSPGATLSGANVAVSWTSPGSQVPGAVYVVTNTLDSHLVCSTSATSCTDTAALPGTVNSYTIHTALGASSWVTNDASFSSPTTPDALLITNTSGGAIGTQTAGTAFAVKVTAQKWQSGSLVTDTAYAGTQTLAWSGLAASPNGNAPTYPATSVSFTSGASTTALNVTAFKAGASTLTVTQGSSSGSASFTVNGAGGALRFTSATPSCTSGGSITISQTGTFVAKLSRDQDSFGNTVATSGTPTVTVSVPNGTKGAVTNGTLNYAGPGSAETTGSFTYTASGKDANGATLTASAAGLVSATCLIKQP